MDLQAGNTYVENALSQYTWFGLHSIQDIKILPINSDPTLGDSDGDLDKDTIDPHPLKTLLNDNLIFNIEKLENLAQTYNSNYHDFYRKYSVDRSIWLTMMFIRQFNNNYVDKNESKTKKWCISGGSIDKSFVNYVKVNDLNLYNYFQETEVGYSNLNGEKFDLRHFAATFTVYIYKTDIIDSQYIENNPTDDLGDLFNNLFRNLQPLMPDKHIDNLGGWAGDLQTLMIDAYNSEENDTFYNLMSNMLGNDSYSFGMQDIYSDIDSSNIYDMIYNYEETDLTSALKSYYSKCYKKRYTLFTQDCSRDDLVDQVKTYTKPYYLLDINSLVWPLFKKADRTHYDFTDEQSNDAVDAYVNFLIMQRAREND